MKPIIAYSWAFLVVFGFPRLPLYKEYRFQDSPARHLRITIDSDTTLHLAYLKRDNGLTSQDLPYKIYKYHYRAINDSMLVITNSKKTKKGIAYYPPLQQYEERNDSLRRALEAIDKSNLSRRKRRAKKEEAITHYLDKTMFYGERAQRIKEDVRYLFPELHQDTVYISRQGRKLRIREFCFVAPADAPLWGR